MIICISLIVRMVQSIINAIVPVAITSIIAVLVATVKAVGDVGIELIGKHKAALEVKIGADTYNQDLAFAKAEWANVDEIFCITPTLKKTFAAKQAEFAVQIKKMIPAITDAEIEQLRQAAAGEVNKGKDAVEAPVADAPQTPVTQQTITVNVTACSYFASVAF